MLKTKIKLSNGLIAQLTESNLSAEIIESSKARGSVIVPRHIDYQSKKYVITRIGDNAFSENRVIDSLSFVTDSSVRSIGNKAFSHSSLKSLSIPASLEELDDWWCFCAKNLNTIEVSPNNENFTFIDDKFLIWKNKDIEMNNRFDVLVFARRNITGTIEVPSSVRRIAPYAFDKCEKFKSLVFKNDGFSKLKVIDYSAFCGCGSLESISDIPETVTTVGNCCFSFARRLVRVEFLAAKVSIGDYCFENCYSLSRASFPNARKVKVGEGSFNEVDCGFQLKVPLYAEVCGEGLTDVRSKIKRISEPFFDDDEINRFQDSPKSSASSQKTSFSPKNSSKSSVASSHSSSGIDKRQRQRQPRHIGVRVLLERIAFLENRLSKYEDVVPFDINGYIKGDSVAKDAYLRVKREEKDKEKSFKNLKEGGFTDYEAFSEEKDANKIKDKDKEKDKEASTCIIADDEKKFHKLIKKIGEGTTSVAYKIIDTRNNHVMCKKFIKIEDGKMSKKGLQNAVKEFTVIAKIKHPSICDAIGINIKEQVRPNFLSKNETNESERDDKGGLGMIITSSLFFEFLELSLKQCIKDNLLTNTMKTKVALEICSGMSHIHRIGLIHSDLRVENIMLNSIMEGKIIGLGLDRIAMFIRKGVSHDEDSHFKSSLMKDISTFAYMSPELQKELEYDNRTDVYSFGVVLHVIFTGKLPKLSLKDKVSGKKVDLPEPSDGISPFCIQLIDKCMEFDPSKRPTFDEILDELQKNSYSLAIDVDADLISRRHRALNRYESLYFGTSSFSS
ncbi:hypothetical protein M9Y10_038846 [Tritrichomonas musculus]|uniref:Protein kinase domain-containing protein n=1 Tax=Tritrichomonas musculus TaxID=1915356 RepID=A0ABR2K9J1_9EUKA